MAKAKQAKAAPTDVLNVLNREYDPECPLSEIQPHPRNARQADIGAIHQSIDYNGFYGALVVQKSTKRILAGNHRYITASQKGAATIPVIWVDVDDAAALRILTVDNRSNDLADYDRNALAELLESIKIDDKEIGLLGTGWDEEAYQALLNDLSGINPAEDQQAGQDTISDKFEVLVTCSNESQQAEVLELMQEKGYDCRALIA